MKRRNLLKLTGALGATLSAPLLPRPLSAQSEDFKGPFWIFVTANGGWDPRLLFDPTLNPEQNTLYTEMGKVGNINFAPYDLEPDSVGLELAEGADRPYYNPERFLNSFGSRITVFNGVDTSTNNHDAGQRAVTSGSIQTGMPAMGALLAATHVPGKPLPFISFGGYDATFDIAPLSRVGNANVLRDLASPNIISPERDDSGSFHTDETWKRIRKAQEDRLSEQLAAQNLPRLRQAQRALEAARSTDRELRALQLPELIDLPGNLGGAEGLLRAGQLALASFQAGLTVAANVSIGGFDTHGNHNDSHTRSMVFLLTGIGHLMNEIDRLGMTDKVYVVVGSDFGRTPHYNEGNGKDHWPVTSYFVSGPGVEGDRVIGATTDDQLSMSIDPKSLKTGDSGVDLSPAQIHGALRKLGKIDENLGVKYALLNDELPLFS